MYTYGLLFVLLICLSSFFSGSEVAFFSLNQSTIDKLKKEKSFFSKRILYLINNPSLLLITILICNTIVNVSAAVIAALFIYNLVDLYKLHQTLLILFEIFLVTIILLIIGEISPKIIARKYSIQFARVAAIPITIMAILFYPVSRLFETMTGYFKSIVKVDSKKSALGMDEMSGLSEIIESQSDIDTTTKKLFYNIGELSKITVKEILVSRVDLLAVEVDTPIEDVKEIVVNSHHSFIPVYENNLDNILGVINSSDILKYYYEDANTKDIRSIINKPLYIPETKEVIGLLKEFQTTRIHIAIVVDEHGGTAGMVTLKDILRYLVGVMEGDVPKILKIDDSTYLAKGSTPLSEIENVLNIIFDTNEFEITTVAGLILQQIKKIPQKGEYIKYKNLLFLVEEVINNRINKVKIRIT